MLTQLGKQGAHPGIKPVVILIRNNQPVKEEQGDTGREPSASTTVPNVSSTQEFHENPASLKEEESAAALHLCTDYLGLAVAVFNTSGVGSGGRRGPAMLADLMASNPNLAAAKRPIRMRDQFNRGVLVPLGWCSLPLAQLAMRIENQHCPLVVDDED